MSLDLVRKNYYTAQEAMTVLGMTRDSFNHYVKSGRIKKIIIPPKKQGVYAKQEIDKLAQRIEAMMLIDESLDLHFQRATPEDVADENYLAWLVLGQRSATPEAKARRRLFIEVNPEVSWYLYDKGKIAASINIVPLKHQAILEFIEGKRGWLFEPDVIGQFAPGSPLELIIIDFMTTPAVPPERREKYAMHLLMHLTWVLKAWGERGVEITRVYANGGTEQGRRILETAGFRRIGEHCDERDERIKRIIYELDVPSSRIKLLKPYKEALAKWKEIHNSI